MSVALRKPQEGALETGAAHGLAVLASPRDAHARHMGRVALVLVLLVGVLFLLNRQWLRENTLVNSPSFDALVYQNQSYDDYLLVRRAGLPALVEKYTSGRWHVPPLHMLSGTFLYLLLGRDPANFYVAPAVWLCLMLLGTYGLLHLWTGQKAWAIVGAGLLATTHSVVAVGLRISQTDFSVGAAFTWALYLLVASDGLRSWRLSLLYGLSVSACVLLKSSIVPYFLAHALIWLLYLAVEPEQRLRRLRNAALAGGVVFVLTGWFFLSNYRQIIAYYSEWGAELSRVTRAYAGITSTIDEVLFYVRSFALYHLGGRNQSLYLLTTALAAASCLAAAVLRKRQAPRPAVASLDGWVERQEAVLASGAEAARPAWFGLAIAAIWLAVPYAILTAYASKAYSVDFPFLAAFFVIPVLLAASAFRGRLLAVGIVLFLPLLAVQARDQIQEMFQGQRVQVWREQEVLADILQDADARGLREAAASNAFIHEHLTSENLRYFVVNGTFWQWQDRYKVLPLHYFFDAQAYYDFLLGADYVLAKTDGYVPAQHPNNVVAPEVNRLLAASPALSILKRYDLPDGSQLVVYRNDTRSGINYPDPPADRWVTQRFPITFYGPARGHTLRLSGRILLPPGLTYPAQLFLENERGEAVTEAVRVVNSEPFEVTLRVPAAALAGGKTTLYLVSDRSFRPVDYGLNADARRLTLILTVLTVADP